MKSYNNRVGCSAPVQVGLETEKKSGFSTVKNKAVLVPLSVVVGDDEYRFHPGGTVWVKGDAFKLAWALEIFRIEGLEFVLVPIDQVFLYKPPVEFARMSSMPLDVGQPFLPGVLDPPRRRKDDIV